MCSLCSYCNECPLVPSDNATASLELIHKLRDDGWLNENTAAIYFDYTVVNHHIRCMQCAHLLVELPREGGAITSVSWVGQTETNVSYEKAEVV